jgi:hypothetical protein
LAVGFFPSLALLPTLGNWELEPAAPGADVVMFSMGSAIAAPGKLKKGIRKKAKVPNASPTTIPNHTTKPK